MNKLTPEEVEQFKRDNPLAVRFVPAEQWFDECMRSSEKWPAHEIGGVVVREGINEYAPEGSLSVVMGSPAFMTPAEWRSFAQFITQWLDERYPE